MGEYVLTKTLAGRSFVLNENNIENFSLPNDGDDCSVSVEYNGQTVTGTAVVIGGEIIITFISEVAIPVGSCITVECVESPSTGIDETCMDFEIGLSPDTRLAILDDKGCLTGWVHFKDLVTKIVNEFAPETLCEALGVEEIPQGNLTAVDRVLTLDDNCEVKSIPISDITCNG